MRDESDQHVGVPITAELETLALIGARSIGLKPEIGGASRNSILLPAERGDPERMNDVPRGELDAHLRADRDVKLLSAGEIRRSVLQPEAILARIAEVPGPLNALGVDDHPHIAAARVVDEVELLP